MSKLKYNRLEEVNYKIILEKLKKNNYVIVDGIFKKKEVEAVLNKIKTEIPKLKDHACIGENASDIMKNYTKLIVGGKMNSWDYRPRCLRVMYNPIWSKNIFGAKNLFIKLSQFRNILQGYPKNFAIKKIEKNLWTASRIQQYHSGGGFFSKHKDFVLKTVTTNVKIRKFLQIILLLTSKGKDFKNGGAYIIDKKGKKIDLEKNAKAGSIILYNSFTEHGVDEIDPQKVIEMNSGKGRIVLIASLYKFFKNKKNYGEFKKYFKN
tara:strand:+ start:2578 stop:3369 length:792 start_codon:yes stop_codon:yes gene_type:complete